MSSIELDLYELLKIKLGEKETKALFTLVEQKVHEKVEGKKDEFITVDDKEKLLTKDFALNVFSTKTDLEKVKAELLVIKWMLGVVLAGIISLMLKAFFV